MIINQLRTYSQYKTTSAVYCDGEFFNTSLEDVGRPYGVKVNEETCIPEGVYRVAITWSHSFNKHMMILYNVVYDHSIESYGIRFTGIRVHRGSTIGHTAGCILLPTYEELQIRVQKELDDGLTVYWIISGGSVS